MRGLSRHLTNDNMNNFASLVLPAVFGLIAGIGHGISSHYQELPFSLSEQILQPFTSEPYLSE